MLPTLGGGVVRRRHVRLDGSKYDRDVAATGSGLVSLDDVEAARGRIAGRLHRTPLLGSATLSKQVGADVRFKAELFQRTGSFKPRGVLNKLATLTAEEKARGVISISAGNHAQALAYASAVEGIDALIVMWATASPRCGLSTARSSPTRPSGPSSRTTACRDSRARARTPDPMAAAHGMPSAPRARCARRLARPSPASAP